MLPFLVYSALNDRKYELAGRIIAYSIVHRGTSPTFMHPMMYTAIAEGVEYARPRVSDLHDAALESKLQEVNAILIHIASVLRLSP